RARDRIAPGGGGLDLIDTPFRPVGVVGIRQGGIGDRCLDSRWVGWTARRVRRPSLLVHVDEHVGVGVAHAREALDTLRDFVGVSIGDVNYILRQGAIRLEQRSIDELTYLLSSPLMYWSCLGIYHVHAAGRGIV